MGNESSAPDTKANVEDIATNTSSTNNVDNTNHVDESNLLITDDSEPVPTNTATEMRGLTYTIPFNAIPNNSIFPDNIEDATPNKRNKRDNNKMRLSPMGMMGGGSWTRTSPLNEPTDEGFKVYIRTQFGDDITVYGLTEDSTMHDIEKRIEVTHGSSSMKTGITIGRTGPPDGISDAEWGFKKDLKLKDLGIKPNDIVLWSTAYQKTEAFISDEVSDKDIHRKVSIDKLLKADKEELKFCGELLKQRGWCLVEYPEIIQKLIDSICKLVNQEIVKEDKKWGQIGDEYGYLKFKVNVNQNGVIWRTTENFEYLAA